MPLFEYHCEGCGKAFEFLALNASEKPGDCPACGSKKIERTLSVFAAPRAGKGESDACEGESPCSRCDGMPGSCPSGFGHGS